MSKGLVLLGFTTRLVCLLPGKLNAQAAIAFHQAKPIAECQEYNPHCQVFQHRTPDGCHFLHTQQSTSKKIVTINSYMVLR